MQGEFSKPNLILHQSHTFADALWICIAPWSMLFLLCFQIQLCNKQAREYCSISETSVLSILHQLTRAESLDAK